MEEYIEVSAKTKEEAIMNAAIQLGTSSDNIEYDVIQEATSGLFGIGRKPAIIRARKKKDISLDFEEAVRDPLKDISAKKSFMKKPAKKFTKEPVKKQPEKTVEKRSSKSHCMLSCRKRYFRKHRSYRFCSRGDAISRNRS